MAIQEIEDRITRLIEMRLNAAEGLLNVGSSRTAKSLLNATASSINQLGYVYTRRRGEPRKAVQMKIFYYWAWHHLLVGTMLYEQPNDEGDKRLKLALKEAEMLVVVELANPAYNALLDKARRYQHN